jgi:hypothetical protein
MELEELMLRNHFRPCAGLLALLIVAGGCDRGGGTIPVQGAVKLDGRPLANASVGFIAQNKGGRDAFGFTNVDGVFQLSTSKINDGALPGKYKVVVQPVAPADSGAPAKTVVEAMAAAARKPPRPAVALPPRYCDPAQTVLVQDVPASGDVVFELRSQ